MFPYRSETLTARVLRVGNGYMVAVTYQPGVDIEDRWRRHPDLLKSFKRAGMDTWMSNQVFEDSQAAESLAIRVCDNSH